jgi:hypothetical protein
MIANLFIGMMIGLLIVATILLWVERIEKPKVEEETPRFLPDQEKKYMEIRYGAQIHNLSEYELNELIKTCFSEENNSESLEEEYGCEIKETKID